MKIMVLGASGYIGHLLVKELKKNKKNRVIVIIRESTKFDFSQLGIEKKDIWLFDKIEKNFKQCNERIDIFINCCCKYQLDNSIVQNLDILDANFYVPMKAFLYSMEYGIKNYITLDTSLPANINFYAKTKEEFANMLKWSVNKEQSGKNVLHVCNILLENYYGENEPSYRFLPSIIKKMKSNNEIFLTEGNQKRDFIYVGDVVKAVIVIINYLVNYSENEALYMDLPLGSGEMVSIREVVSYLHEIINSKSILHFGAIPKRENEPSTVADLTIGKKIGIEIEYNWKQGMKKII